MKRILLIIASILTFISCDNSSSSNDSQGYVDDNTFYGPVYQGFIGKDIGFGMMDTIAPIQISFAFSGSIVEGAFRIGVLKSKWNGKISLPFGHFKGDATELTTAIGTISGFNKVADKIDSLWFVIGNADFSNPYKASIYGGIHPSDSIVFEASK